MADRKTTTESEIKSKIEVVQIDGLVRKMKFNHVTAKYDLFYFFQSYSPKKYLCFVNTTY